MVIAGSCTIEAASAVPVAGPPPAASNNGTATLTWAAPTQNGDGTALTNLAGYQIDYGTDSNALTKSVQVPNAGATSYTLTSLGSGTWYFEVRAYTNSGLESGWSNVASKSIN